MAQYLIVGIISPNWVNDTFTVFPFKSGEEALTRAKRQIDFKVHKKKHLVETAIDWHSKKAANPHIQTTEIAKKAGISDGRARQIIRLARLHQEILKTITAMPPKLARKRFPERILRKWIVLTHNQQLSQFREYHVD